MQVTNIHQQYRVLGKLGKGAYGEVFRAKDRSDNSVCAIKRIRLESNDDGIAATTLREIAALQELNHPNVVGLKDVVLDANRKLHLVFEFLDRDLRGHLELHKEHGLDKMEIKSLMYQLLTGIAFCHMNRILHRDLKPQNVLVTKSGQLKIADFGLARMFTLPVAQFTHEVVTLWYRAPEVLLGSKTYSTPVDMWSVGCIFAELANGSPPFHGESEIEQLFHIFKVLGAPSEDVWPGVSQLPDYQSVFPNFKATPWNEVAPALDENGLDLLAQLLRYDPAERISAKRALNHPYFDDLDKGQFVGYMEFM